MTSIQTLPEHQLSGTDFDSLAHGRGGSSAVHVLSAGQVSRRKLLVLGLCEELAARPGQARAAALLGQACDLIDDADLASASRPSPGEEVLLHPYLEVWAIDLLRGLTRPDAAEQSATWSAVRASYLLAAAGVAALRAGQAVDIELLVPASGLAVPTAGRFVVDTPDQPFEARLSTTGGELTLKATDGRRIRWEPLRRFVDGVGLETTDPYRDTFDYPVETGLGSDRVALWERSYVAARALISAEYPEYAPELDAGLRSITPLVAPADGHDASAAARQAYGAVGCMLPTSPAGLALLLLHEFQHVKLAALIDLVPLCDPDDGTLHHAPWRPDPRPLGALLQGTYAHLAVTEFWRRQRDLSSDRAQVAAIAPLRAAEQFDRWSTQTAQVIEVLARAPGMNDQGRRFVAGMAAAAHQR